jgi:predicted DNA-binding transcriptional regulator AlpA
MTKNAGYHPRYLMPPRHLASASTLALNLISGEAMQNLDEQFDALIEAAQKCHTSPLVRKAKAFTRFAIGSSTFLKKVAAGELPQPAYRDGRVTAYREIDLDMMLAAQALATRNGFMLNGRAFVAALCAPINVSAKASA